MNQELLVAKLKSVTTFLQAVSLCTQFLPAKLRVQIEEMLHYTLEEMKDICTILKDEQNVKPTIRSRTRRKSSINVNEKVFKFSIEITGDFYYEYQGTLDTDELEIANMIKGRIENLLLSQGDVDLDEISVGVH